MSDGQKRRPADLLHTSFAFENNIKWQTGVDSCFSFKGRSIHLRKKTSASAPKILYADDCDLMMNLMRRSQPSLPGCTNQPANQNAAVKWDTEPHMYEKRLSPPLDVSARKKGSTTRSLHCGKDAAAGTPFPQNHKPAEEHTTAVEKGALQLWAEEEQQRRSISRSACAFCTRRSLVEAVKKGRFPIDANATVAEAIRKWEEEEERQENLNGTLMAASAAFSESLTLPSRLKQEPRCIWPMVNSMTSPQNSFRSDRRRHVQYADESLHFPDEWQERFDHVNYTKQYEMDESLAARDFCRCMVIRHETAATGEPPLSALAKMFENDRANSALERSLVSSRLGKGFIWASVWMRKANEIALEKERETIIKAICGFQLRVAAASLSREAVSDLQNSLIRMLKELPCNYRKHHIFTKIDFVKWIKKRYNLPSSAGINEMDSASLVECMASSAEAAFVEYVLGILPSKNNSILFRVPRSAS